MQGEEYCSVARVPSYIRSGFLFLLLSSLLLCSSLLKADPTQGPGGPVLVVTSADSPYGTYYAEILRTEGFNLFAVEDIAAVTPTLLSAYDLVVLAEMPLTPSQVTVFTDWVTAGGQLIAMDPDTDLAGLLGLAPAGGQISEGYVLVDGASPVGSGIVNETMQFHGTASLFALNGAQSLATLYTSASNASVYPAVTLNAVGSNGGQAAAFAFDLATSIVYTRQGNPAWEGQDRDGSPPIRSNDLFFGASATDPQPDWVDLSKVAIPQADEQQRFLANLIVEMNRARQPLPRFWYFPRGERAVVVLTGDDHGVLTPGDVFDRLEQLSPVGCAVEDWECLRMSLYVYPNTNLTDVEAAAYVSNGFEVGAHVNTGCADYDAASLDGFLAGDLGTFAGIYPSIPAPVSTRYHCIAWSDWATGAKGALDYGIRFDTNYYYWPPGWVNDTPGHFTGSAMPMRFADLDGTLIDVFQAVTQMTDESGQSYPETIDTLLDRALGSEQQFGAYTVNAHTDGIFPAIHEAIAQSALSRNVSVVTSRQMLEWLDGRNDSSFDNLTWDGTTLGFTVTAAAGARGLEAMIPYLSGDGVLVSVSRNGQDQSFQVATIKGIAYARVPADGGGAFTAVYDPNADPGDIEAPVITDRTPTPGATGVDPAVVLTATFDEALDPGTVNGSTFELRDAAEALVPATVSYDPGTFTVSLTPSVALDPGSQYTATLRGGPAEPRITDLAGNALAADSTWTFTTTTVAGECPCTVWDDGTTPGVTSSSDPGSVELGVKFRPLVDGFVTGVRFYKGSGNTGTHVGNLWAEDGTLLARATFSNETSSGWQTVLFDTPVAVTAGAVYVASYFAPNGGYAIDLNFFTGSVSNGLLELLADGDVGGNGVYNYGPSSAFPNQTYQSSNYWVDVVFTDEVGPDTTAPEVVDRSPAPGATDVNFGTAVTATFSEDLDSATVDASSFQLRDGGGNLLSADVSYDGASRTAVLAPDSLLLPSTVYTATLVGGAGGLADLAGNALAGDVSWSFTTQSVDTTAPTVTGRDPAPGATNVAVGVAVSAVFDEPLDPASVNTASFELRDPGGTPVTAAISYDTITRTAVLSPSLQLLPSTTYTATLQGGAGSSITDAVGNPLAADVSWSFTTRDPDGCPCSVWDDTTVPGTITEQDSNSVELGMKFTTSVDGFVTGVRFYKGPQNTGTHEGRLWALDGTLLAEVTFTNESASGWQEASFAEPVAVTAGTVYVVSYLAPNGFYSGDNGYFAGTGVTNGPLRALQDGENGGNGVYQYGNGGFPNQTWQASNYWVDVVFTQ